MKNLPQTVKTGDGRVMRSNSTLKDLPNNKSADADSQEKKRFIEVDGQVFDRILVVDDEPAIREIIREALTRYGYQVRTAEDGIKALELIEQHEFDVIVTDLSMPNLDGFGLMKRALIIQPMTAVIVLSGQGTFENAIEAVHRGAYDFVPKPVRDFEAFRITIDRGLEHKGLLVKNLNYQRHLEARVEEQTQQIKNASISFINTLLIALEEKDQYTAGHSRRVTYYAVEIAKRLNLDDDVWKIETAGKLHDMGKLMIDLSYVNKPGPLNDEEWKIMKEHPAIADRILVHLPFLKDVRPIIRHHHERMNGSGYPDGLSGEEFDLPTQILAVADSYDAMTSKRSYRDPMPMEDAIAELKRWVGTYWLAEPVNALIDLLNSE